MAIDPALPQTPLVLDTDVVNDWRFQKPQTLQLINDYLSRFKRPPALTSMTIFEILHGFENVAAKPGGLNARTHQDRVKTEQLIQTCDVLPLNEIAASIAAHIFPRLSQGQRNKHWKDMFIAATALAHGYGVATRNRDDFELIAKHLPPSHPILRLAVWKP